VVGQRSDASASPACSLSFREHLPTFMCAVQVHILDDAQEGGRGWLENALPLEMAVEELPLAPYRRP
jgi:hypothetical protein